MSQLSRIEIFKQAARPFVIYASTITVCAGVLIGKSAEALMVAASLGGANAAMRSFDKRTLKGVADPSSPAG